MLAVLLSSLPRSIYTSKPSRAISILTWEVLITFASQCLCSLASSHTFYLHDFHLMDVSNSSLLLITELVNPFVATCHNVTCPLAATHLFRLLVKDTAVCWCPCCPCGRHTITSARKGMKLLRPTEQRSGPSRETKSCLLHNGDTNASDINYNGNISRVMFS